MAFTYKDLQDEVKRRSIRDKSSTEFDVAIKNAINLTLFRVSRDAPWRVMRRRNTFDTVTSYTTGTGAASATSGTVNATLNTATLLTDDVHIDRYIKFGGSAKYYKVASITGETTVTLNQVYTAATMTTMSYEIFPQREYNLPIQAGHRAFLWHEDYGYPYLMNFMTDQDMVWLGLHHWEKNIPTHYMMWGEDMAEQQPKQAGTLTVFSTKSGDTSIGVTIFGTSGGYPAYEIITTNSSDGTTATTGGVSFSEVERVVKNASTAGRVGVYADAGTATTVATLPIGDTTAGITYRKIQLFPLPTRVFPVNVQYYKDPYRLVNDGDVHELGQDFDEAIITLAVAKLKGETDQKEASVFFAMFKDELKTLRRTNTDKIDWYPELRRPRSNRGDLRVTSNLLYRQMGSNFGPSFRGRR